MLMDTPYQIKTYQCNMAAFLQLGKWFDYLREQRVYDNTRIIIVADHGFALEHFEDMKFGERDGERTEHNPEDVMGYNPLLLVKDFNSKGFHLDDRFMTNADTPLLALDRIIDTPVNPFSGKVITDASKNAEEFHVFYTDVTDPWINNGNTFLPGRWYALHGQNIFDMSSWNNLGYY